MNETPPTVDASRVRVMVADDHLVVRMGLRALLTAEPRIEIVGEASSGTEALALASSLQPEVVLLDLRLPGLDGLEVCRRLKLGVPSPAVLFLTSYADDQAVLAAIEAGADGYLLKALAGQNVASSILAVARGESVLDPVVTRRVLESARRLAAPGAVKPGGMEQLTAQESRVLEQVALGRSNRRIAQELNLSDGTVRNYLSSVFAKLGVASRVEAALRWVAMAQGSGASRVEKGKPGAADA